MDSQQNPAATAGGQQQEGETEHQTQIKQTDEPSQPQQTQTTTTPAAATAEAAPPTAVPKKREHQQARNTHARAPTSGPEKVAAKRPRTRLSDQQQEHDSEQEHTGDSESAGDGDDTGSTSSEDEGQQFACNDDSDYGAPRRQKRRKKATAAVRGRGGPRSRHTTSSQTTPPPQTPSQTPAPTSAGAAAAAATQRSKGERTSYSQPPHFVNGHKYPFVVNKWVSVRCFGSFAEFEPGTGTLPKAYTPLMVCQSTRSTLWPIGFESQRLFYDFTGAGVMRLYVCTVLVDREHEPPALKWRIKAHDDTGESVESSDPNEVMRLFKARLAVINDNPIHNSWLSDAEHFFGINHYDVADIVHSLPHHNEVLALLAPDMPLPPLKAEPVQLPTEPYVEPPNLGQTRRRKRRNRNRKGAARADAAGLQQQDSEDSQQEAAQDEEPAKEEAAEAPAQNKHASIDPISHFTFALPQVPMSAALKRLCEPIDAADMAACAREQAAKPEGALGTAQAADEVREMPSPGSAEAIEITTDTQAQDELAKLVNTLNRAERVIMSLAETNHQLRMLDRLYTQQQAEKQASKQPPAHSGLPEQPHD